MTKKKKKRKEKEKNPEPKLVKKKKKGKKEKERQNEDVRSEFLWRGSGSTNNQGLGEKRSIEPLSPCSPGETRPPLATGPPQSSLSPAGVGAAWGLTSELLKWECSQQSPAEASSLFVKETSNTADPRGLKCCRALQSLAPNSCQRRWRQLRQWVVVW